MGFGVINSTLISIFYWNVTAGQMGENLFSVRRCLLSVVGHKGFFIGWLMRIVVVVLVIFICNDDERD